MSTQLGLNVVAEGVETMEQLEFLRSHGCHHIQGFVCSRPLSSTQFFAMLQNIGQPAANIQVDGQATA